jgi:hypothetical protein
MFERLSNLRKVALTLLSGTVGAALAVLGVLQPLFDGLGGVIGFLGTTSTQWFGILSIMTGVAQFVPWIPADTIIGLFVGGAFFVAAWKLSKIINQARERFGHLVPEVLSR